MASTLDDLRDGSVLADAVTHIAGGLAAPPDVPGGGSSVALVRLEAPADMLDALTLPPGLSLPISSGALAGTLRFGARAADLPGVVFGRAT